MRSRRGFIKTASAAAVAPLVSVGVWPGAGRAQAAGPAAVVFDSDFEAARDFGAEARRLGLATHAITGDVTRLWLEVVEPLWRSGPVPIGGLTRQGALFCLEQLARDAGRRVVLQIDHGLSSTGDIEHAVFGAGAAADGILDRLRGASPRFGVAAARLMAEPPPANEAVVWRSGAVATAGRPEPLVTWIIAPRTAA